MKKSHKDLHMKATEDKFGFFFFFFFTQHDVSKLNFESA